MKRYVQKHDKDLGRVKGKIGPVFKAHKIFNNIFLE